MSESRFAGHSYFLDGPDGREPLGASYDAIADVLYLWRGAVAVEAVSVSSDDGPIVRLDPESGELVGVTLLDWSACWADKETVELVVPQAGRSEREVRPAAESPQRQLVLA